MALSSCIPICPRYAETDQSGFVAEGRYVAWLELGRAALLKAHGFDYRDFEAQGYWMPVLEVGFTFHGPACYDDALALTTSLGSRPSFRIRLDYAIHRGEELLATAYSVQAFVNRSLRPAPRSRDTRP